MKFLYTFFIVFLISIPYLIAGNNSAKVNNDYLAGSYIINNWVIEGENSTEIEFAQELLSNWDADYMMTISIDSEQKIKKTISEINSLQEQTGKIELEHNFGGAGSNHILLLKIENTEGSELTRSEYKIRTAIGGTSKKMVLLEMACGVLCSGCIDHIEEIHNLAYEHRNDVAVVVYNKAPVGVGEWQKDNPYSNFHSIFNVLYQSGVIVDRFMDTENQAEAGGGVSEVCEDANITINKRLETDYVPASISASVNFDTLTRKVDIDYQAEFTDYASGDLGFYIVLTQDTVIGPDGTSSHTSYAQACPGLKATEYGYNWKELFGYWSAIPEYPHNYVCKYQPDGFFGKEDVFPDEIDPGDKVSDLTSFTLPVYGNEGLDYDVVPIDPTRIEIIVALVRKGEFKQREVLNACRIPLIPRPTNVEEKFENGLHFVLHKKIASETLSYSIGSEIPANAHINIIDLTGRTVVSRDMFISESIRNRIIDISQLANGLYIFRISVQGSQIVEKFIVAD